MTRAARLLYIGVSEEDFPILAQYVRPAPNTEIRTLTLHSLYDNPDAAPQLIDTFGEWKADMVVYSPYMADRAEVEALVVSMLAPDAPA